jgi:hypothetical protein
MLRQTIRELGMCFRLARTPFVEGADVLELADGSAPMAWATRVNLAMMGRW